VNEKSIEEVLAMHRTRLMSLPGAIGVGIGKTENILCIIVFVKKVTPELQMVAPRQLEGHPVILKKSGTLIAPND
jgi:hypothetical protein